MPTYEYPRPMLTVDIVIFRFPENFRMGHMHTSFEILLIKRKNAPFKGLWALPGGYVDENENIRLAALRELKEETSIDAVAEHIEINQFTPLRDREDRDPRGWTISVPHVGITHDYQLVPKARDDATEAKFITTTLDAINTSCIGLELAFDHNSIVYNAYSQILLRRRWYGSFKYQM